VRRKNPNNRSSGLNLSNASNALRGGHLQQALGGEHHETCFCTCWSRRAWRRCTVYRNRVCDALRHSRPGLAGFQRRAGGVRLQRLGPLLAPAKLRRRLLPSALLWRLGLAPLASLASIRWLGIRRRLASLASALPWRWLGVASLAPLAPMVVGKKGASAPFFLPVADSRNAFVAFPHRNTRRRRAGLAHRSLEPNPASAQWNDTNHITSRARRFRRQ
jgi:hypothetical protein